MKNTIKTIKNIIFTSLLLLLMLGISQADSINITAGHVWQANLDSVSDTSLWSGMKIIATSDPLSESTSPFTNITFVQGGVGAYEFPGGNFNDDAHYFAAMIPNNFDSSKLLNVSDSDLNEYSMFNVSQFSDFYAPIDYYDLNDNPQETFCCNKSDVTIGGINYSAFIVTLENNTNYHVLKYNNSGTMTPLFLTLFTNSNQCYSGNLNFGNQSYENSSTCDSQFMIPRYQTYNFYILSKYPAFTYTIWIDGVETIMFENTAIPYNLTVEVRYLYNNQTAPNQNLVAVEELGHNLFIPYYLNGFISSAYSVGKTNANGRETFIVAPTAYDSTTPENYSFYVAVLLNGLFVSPQTLVVNGTDDLTKSKFKKPLSPTRLYDNVKVNINSMNQIVNSLYKWATDAKARRFQITYELSNHTITYFDFSQGPVSNITLKTGAPNVIKLIVNNNNILQPDYFGKIEESQGYLILNPNSDNVTLNTKQRLHYTYFNVNENFIVAPTSIEYMTESTLNLQILNPSGNIVDEFDLGIDATIDSNMAGTFYYDDSMATIINSMNQIINTLFYSLN